jgi:hypothetical protein
MLTVGRPLGTNGWRLAAADLDNALVRPPEGFVGPMDVVLELRLADDTLIDRKPLRLEWVSAAPKQSTGNSIRQLDRQEIADLIRRGEGFIVTGDSRIGALGVAARGRGRRPASGADAGGNL